MDQERENIHDWKEPANINIGSAYTSKHTNTHTDPAINTAWKQHIRRKLNGKDGQKKSEGVKTIRQEIQIHQWHLFLTFIDSPTKYFSIIITSFLRLFYFFFIRYLLRITAILSNLFGVQSVLEIKVYNCRGKIAII